MSVAIPGQSKTKVKKPTKPKGFPLTVNGNGQWSKVIGGKVLYFGKWDDPKAALARYLDHCAGRTANPAAGLTVRDLCNRFLTKKRSLVESREFSPRSFAMLHSACERIITAFGPSRIVKELTPDDFASLRSSIARRWGVSALSNEITRVRTIFKFAYDENLIEVPIRYGTSFDKPKKAVMRKDRNERGEKMLEADDIQKLLAAASTQVRAMILLAVNCGFGNGDISALPRSALDLKAGWANFPRPKTGIHRRCPLWPETVQAIEQAIRDRPTPKLADDAELVFITKYGYRWVRFRLADGKPSENLKGTPIDSVANEFGKLLRGTKTHRLGIGFYTLRHVFATIGGESRDQVAVNYIMGHSPGGNDMSAIYRERISDDRLRAVVETVRGWLFDQKQKAK